MSDLDVHAIRHGYNLADLEMLARAAVAAAYSQVQDYLDRYDTAWFAIVEALYTAEQRPEPWQLKHAGVTAVNREGQDHGRHHGHDRRTPEAGYEAARGFLRYWELDSRPTGSCEERVCDQLALWQIWPTLSETHRAVLLALAAHEDQQAAANAVDKSYGCFGSHLKDARRGFLKLWHEGEEPSRLWGKNDRRRSSKYAGTKILAVRRRQGKKVAA